MHPSEATDFEWDEGNEGELWGHRVTREEVEEVFDNHPLWMRIKGDRSAEWLMIGRTNGGRYLTIAVTSSDKPWSCRAITGWDSTPPERGLRG